MQKGHDFGVSNIPLMSFKNATFALLIKDILQKVKRLVSVVDVFLFNGMLNYCNYTL